MSNEFDQLVQQAETTTGHSVLETIYRIAKVRQDEIDAPLPHRTPSLTRINEHWAQRDIRKH